MSACSQGGNHPIPMRTTAFGGVSLTLRLLHGHGWIWKPGQRAHSLRCRQLKPEELGCSREALSWRWRKSQRGASLDLQWKRWRFHLCRWTEERGREVSPPREGWMGKVTSGWQRWCRVTLGVRITRGTDGGGSNGDCSTHSRDKRLVHFRCRNEDSPAHGMKSTHARVHTSGSDWSQGAHRGQGCQQELSTRQGSQNHRIIQIGKAL